MGIGDWGLGIGDWAQSPIPNPHPQSPIPICFILYLTINIDYVIILKYQLILLKLNIKWINLMISLI